MLEQNRIPEGENTLDGSAKSAEAATVNTEITESGFEVRDTKEEQLLIMRRHRKNPAASWGGNLRAQMLPRGLAKIAKASLQGMLLSRATAGMEYKMQLSRAGGPLAKGDFWSWPSPQQRKKLGETAELLYQVTGLDPGWKSGALGHISQEWNVTGRERRG